MMASGSLARRALVTMLIMAAMLPVVLWGVVRATAQMENLPILWMPADHPQRRQLDEFRQRFDARDSIFVSWVGCTVDDPRLVEFSRALLANEPAPSGAEEDPLFERVITGYGMLRDLMAEPLTLSRDQAVGRLQGVLVGPDGQTSGAVAVLSAPASSGAREQAVRAVRRALEETLELEADEYFLAGSPVESEAIDRAAGRSLTMLLLPSALLVLGLARLCLRSWRLTAGVILIAGFGELLVLALVHYAGASMNAVLVVMAPLVFVLTVSAGVHLVNYYYDELRLHGAAGAAERGLRKGFVPCTLAAATTAIGLGSLIVSDMRPIRDFGALAAVGVLLATGLLLLVLPGLERPAAQPRRGAAPPSGLRPAAWRRLAAIVDRRAGTIAAAALLLLVAGLWGMTQLRTSVSVMHLMTPGSRIVQDHRWLERHWAPVVPVEMQVHFDADCPLDLLQRVELLRQLQRQLDDVDALGGSLSAADFVPSVPWGRGLAATARRGALRSQLAGQLPEFREARLFYESDGDQWWRISTRATALENVDYGTLLDEMNQRMEPVLQAYGQRGLGGIHVSLTGVTPLVHAAQQMLLHDLITSFLTALLLVALVLVFVLRSIFAALAAMLPNVFPTVVLFGLMGWAGVPVDIGTMMTASVALGIAIDGTLHLLIWYRREAALGHAPREAVERAFGHCATALCQTAVICGLGLLVFALSDFVPARRFAWMMLALLLTALVGDLLLLPSLVLGPFRRIFR